MSTECAGQARRAFRKRFRGPCAAPIGAGTLPAFTSSNMARHDYDEIRRHIRSIVEDVIRPNADRVDREGIFPRENLTALARAGYNGILLPTDLGGLALDHVAFALVTEEIGASLRVDRPSLRHARRRCADRRALRE